MLRIATWHEHMRQLFEEAATQSGTPIPVSQPFPPEEWRSPEEKTATAGM
jgi:hypothetical protein